MAYLPKEKDYDKIVNVALATKRQSKKKATANGLAETVAVTIYPRGRGRRTKLLPMKFYFTIRELTVIIAFFEGNRSELNFTEPASTFTEGVGYKILLKKNSFNSLTLELESVTDTNKVQKYINYLDGHNRDKFIRELTESLTKMEKRV